MNKWRAVVAVVVVFATACAGPFVRSDFDSGADFGDYRSFAWLEPATADVENPLLDSPLLGRKIERAVLATLAGRGFASTAADDADFLVTYHTSVRERVRDSGVNVGLTFGSGYSRGLRTIVVGDQFGANSYQEGTLMIDIIDAGTDELVWRGWSTANVHPDRYTDEAVTEAVQAILAKFPPS